MADVKPILVRFPAAVATLVDEHVSAVGAPSRNAAIVDLVVRGLAGAEALPEAAGSPGMASGPGGSLSANGTPCESSSPEPLGAAAPAEGDSQGASKAEPLRTVPRRDPAGTEAPLHCAHGKESGAFCYPCGGRVP